MPIASLAERRADWGDFDALPIGGSRPAREASRSALAPAGPHRMTTLRLRHALARALGPSRVLSRPKDGGIASVLRTSHLRS